MFQGNVLFLLPLKNSGNQMFLGEIGMVHWPEIGLLRLSDLQFPQP